MIIGKRVDDNELTITMMMMVVMITMVTIVCKSYVPYLSWFIPLGNVLNITSIVLPNPWIQLTGVPEIRMSTENHLSVNVKPF